MIPAWRLCAHFTPPWTLPKWAGPSAQGRRIEISPRQDSGLWSTRPLRFGDSRVTRGSTRPLRFGKGQAAFRFSGRKMRWGRFERITS